MWSKEELIDKQAEFWVVLARGARLQAACDAVGVNRRTGRRWRQATGGRVPRKRPEPSGRYLSLAERLQIADLWLAGVGVRAIATQLGRAPSTISRELTRNGLGPLGVVGTSGTSGTADGIDASVVLGAQARGRRIAFMPTIGLKGPPESSHRSRLRA